MSGTDRRTVVKPPTGAVKFDQQFGKTDMLLVIDYFLLAISSMERIALIENSR
jgi:hypothetical protein